MRWIATSRVVCFSVVFTALVGSTYAQFRDVTPVKPPEVQETPAASLDQAPEPIPQPVAMPEPVPEPALKEATTPEPTESRFSVEELNQMLSDEDNKANGDDYKLRSLKFRGVTVGESSLEDMLSLWGKPEGIVKSANSRILKYRPAPFRQVDATVIDEQVVSLLIHLNDELDPAHCSRELRLTHLEPVPVPDSYGRVMGLAFPERGVLYSFDTRGPDLLVSKIQLEPVNPEPFVLRAEYDYENRLDMNLEDLDIAIEMSPRYARAHWVRSQKLREAGRYKDALEAADKAVHFDPTNDHYRMCKAVLMADNGNYDASRREAGRVLEQVQLPSYLEAMGESLLGRLSAEGHGSDYKEAMEHHLKAIEMAAPLANSREFLTRRMAKRILIESHMCVSRNISLGDFQRQDVVVPKWISRSRALVEEFVKRDQGDASLRLDIYRLMFATAADLRNTDNPDRILSEFLEEAQAQIEMTGDPRDKARLEWKLGAGLAEAVRLQRTRGKEDSAIELADQALVLMQQSAKQRQSTPDQRYLVGRLYFHVGSLHAVQRQDHDEAIAWYRKAEPLLVGEVPPGVLADPGTHGEMFVSMGVSYWETANRKQAIRLTELGTDVLQRAVVDGAIKPESLGIPYGNLSNMHKKVGNEKESSAFAELADAIKTESTLR